MRFASNATCICCVAKLAGLSKGDDPCEAETWINTRLTKLLGTNPELLSDADLGRKYRQFLKNYSARDNLSRLDVDRLADDGLSVIRANPELSR